MLLAGLGNAATHKPVVDVGKVVIFKDFDRYIVIGVVCAHTRAATVPFDTRAIAAGQDEETRDETQRATLSFELYDDPLPFFPPSSATQLGPDSGPPVIYRLFVIARRESEMSPRPRPRTYACRSTLPSKS
jgi:hypothetical protein